MKEGRANVKEGRKERSHPIKEATKEERNKRKKKIMKEHKNKRNKGTKKRRNVLILIEIGHIKLQECFSLILNQQRRVFLVAHIEV